MLGKQFPSNYAKSIACFLLSCTILLKYITYQAVSGSWSIDGVCLSEFSIFVTSLIYEYKYKHCLCKNTEFERSSAESYFVQV